TVPQFTLGLTVPQATTPSPAVISVAGDAPLVADLAVWTQPDSSAGCATTLEAEGARSGATFAMEQGVLGAYHQSQAIAAADGTRLICAYLERPFTYTPLARAQGRVTLGPAPQPSPGTGTGAGGSGSSGSTVSTSSTPPQPSSPGAGQTTGANSAQPVTEAAAPSPSTGTVPGAALTGSALGRAPARP